MEEAKHSGTLDLVEDLVSVIIPVHNATQWLDDCIRSIVLQTYRPIEISVYDDESTVQYHLPPPFSLYLSCV